MQLVNQIGQMQDADHFLNDLDMVRLIRRIDDHFTDQEALSFLKKYLCTDKLEIQERSLLLQELIAKSSLSEMTELRDILYQMPQEDLKYEQSSDRIHQVLYESRRVRLYLSAVEKLVDIGSRGFPPGV